MTRWHSPGGRARNVARPFPYRPRLEGLEARCLPSTVTNLNDAGPGSLRQAIVDTAAGGTVDFEPGLSGTITLTSGELLIDKDLTIRGPGANAVTVSGSLSSRVFDISTAGTVRITGLTVADGLGDIVGGGILNRGALAIDSSSVRGNNVLADVGSGCGIANYGTLTVTYSTIRDNVGVCLGGGIANYGVLSVDSSTLSGNSAGSEGGGLLNNDGRATVTDSTIAGNSADGTGGGIFNAGEGSLTVTGCTIAGNSAANGGGTYSPIGLFTRDTIIAGNLGGSGPDVLGNLDSQGHNLIGDTSGGSGFVPSDLLNVDPQLGPLQDNGGPTFTMALLPGSLAIDAGDNTGAPMWDQRGAPFRRIVNGIIDIGAFEVQARGHGGPNRQPLPDPVPVQILGTPTGPLFDQPPDLPAAPSPLPGMGAPDRQAGQLGPELVPVPAAGCPPAAEDFSANFAGAGQLTDPLSLLGVLSVNLP